MITIVVVASPLMVIIVVVTMLILLTLRFGFQRLSVSSRSLAAPMLSKNVETLKNMNSTTGKFAKWYVRILSPKIIPYTFTAKGEDVSAERFECVLVSQDANQYMFGSVPFSFKEAQATRKAQDTFKENKVFEITTPAFDAKAKPEFNGCPVKSVLLLKKPTTLEAVPPQTERCWNTPPRVSR